MVETIASPEAAIEHQNNAVLVTVPPKVSTVPSVKNVYNRIDGMGPRKPIQKKIRCNRVSSLIFKQSCRCQLDAKQKLAGNGEDALIT